MKSIEDFERYFQTDMLPHLEALDARRKIILKKWMRVAFYALVVFIISAIVVGSMDFGQSDNPGLKYFVTFAIVVVIGAIFGSFYARDKTFYSDFKLQVIERIVKFASSELTYEPLNYISSSIFQSSRIFMKSIDRYKGDDLVYGTIDKTKISFSELKAEYVTRHRDSKGRTKERWHTIFKGLFFVADFNKHFQVSTVVLPNRLGKGFLADLFKKVNISRREKLVKLEDPDFNKHFVVYSDDQIEARYVLSTSLMRRITEFKEKHPNNLFLSFVNSQLFVAISYAKNLFEPNYFRKLTDFSLVKEYFEDLHLAVSIVEELNLNNRIWTKQ